MAYGFHAVQVNSRARRSHNGVSDAHDLVIAKGSRGQRDHLSEPLRERPSSAAQLALTSHDATQALIPSNWL